ncbi:MULTISPECIES: hypothetical protein [Mycobacteroides]|uniref:hypothetical protein n=1 Tax=Mycobacteroides TaxID=670516 RepID=UPI0009C4A915|nr:MULTISPECIES: hypothetical protein [Mycobacteroides]SLF13711.1 Uncharacterised protein [Mycobacteroides abscessus subsp. massiliense]
MNSPETTVTPEPLAAPNKQHADIKGINNAAIIIGLQSKHVYAGTVPESVVRQRRAKNRDARRARRGNVSALRRQARLNRKVRRPGRRMPYDMGHLIGAVPGHPWLVVTEDKPDLSSWDGVRGAYQRLRDSGMNAAEALAEMVEPKAGAAE